MSFWTPNSIRTACAGRWLARPKNILDDEVVKGVSIDTRSLNAGDAFLALKGDRLDSHDFLTDAVGAGASMLIVSDDAKVPVDLPARVAVVRVADTRAALMKLAAVYRRSFEGVRVVAVTGSNGKTTICRLIDAALSTRFRGVTSEKSFNNDIGVPLTILRVRPGDQYLICEVGANERGEIPALARVVEPDVAVITSIGRAHLEGFGSIENLIREKASLLSYLRPGGLAIGPTGVPVLEDFLRTAPNKITFGKSDEADLRISDVEHVDDVAGRPGVRFAVNQRASFEVPLLGEHNAINANAAIAVARRFGLDHETIAAGLRGAAGAEMRLTSCAVGDHRVLNDAYNANPESAAAAIATFLALESDAPRRVVVLGDMLELGEEGPALHAEIGQLLAESADVDFFIAVGSLALHAAERFERTRDPKELMLIQSLDESAVERIVTSLNPGDAVLLKGSRGVRLERIEEALRARAGSAAAPAVRVEPAAAARRAGARTT